jgi:hypothetical protein
MANEHNPWVCAACRGGHEVDEGTLDEDVFVVGVENYAEVIWGSKLVLDSNRSLVTSLLRIEM